MVSIRNALPHGLTELPDCTSVRTQLKSLPVVKDHQVTVNARKVPQMREDHSRIGYIFPDEQVLVLSNGIIYERASEFRSTRAAMFVDHAAIRCQEALPATLPSLIRKVGVLEIKRFIQQVKTANLDKFVAVDRARATSSPKHRYRAAALICPIYLVVPQIKESPFPTCTCFSGFFPPSRRVLKEDLRSDSKHRWIRKSGQEWLKEASIDDHVIVQQNDDICLHLCDSTVVAPGKPIVAIERQDLYRREGIPDEFHAPVSTPIVNYQNFMAAARMLDSFDN